MIKNSFHKLRIMPCRTIFLVVLFAIAVAKPAYLMDSSRAPVQSVQKSNSQMADFVSQVSAKSDTQAVGLKRANSCADCPAGKSFDLSVEDLQSGKAVPVTIANLTTQIDDIAIVSQSRAVVFGRVTGTMQSVNIINTATGAVEDYFYCNFSVLSKDKRYLAFVKGAPRFSSPSEWSYVYLVYDLSESPKTNKLARNIDSANMPDDRMNVGVPIYPQANVRQQSYVADLDLEESQVHLLGSEGLFWLEDDQLAFVDRWNKTNRLVVADLRWGLAGARVKSKELDTSALVNLSVCNESVEAPENLIVVTDISASPDSSGALLLRFKKIGRCLRQSSLRVAFD